MKKDAEHRAEMARRAERRRARSARTAEEGPTPHNSGPKKTTTNAAVVKAAHDKRKRRELRRLQLKAKTVGFGRD